MAKLPPNSGKPWTSKDVSTIKEIVSLGVV